MNVQVAHIEEIQRDRDNLAKIILQVRHELEGIDWGDLTKAEQNIWRTITIDEHPSLGGR